MSISSVPKLATRRIEYNYLNTFVARKLQFAQLTIMNSKVTIR